MLNVYRLSQILLSLEVLTQLAVVITEAISNSVYKTFPPSTVMMGYSGQSLLVIIVAILLILMSLLVLKNLGRILVQTSWKISVSCIGFSLASIAFRTFSSNFIVSSSSSYYIGTYNITSYFIVIGAVFWIPFIFCKSDKWQPPPSPDAERHRIRSTGGNRGLVTHRPHPDEDNRSIVSEEREELPSYYEMMPPPTYKNLIPQNPNENDDSSPSQANLVLDAADDDVDMADHTRYTNNATAPSINDAADEDRSPPPSINAVYMNNENEQGYSPSSVVINIDENSSSVPDNHINNALRPPPPVTNSNQNTGGDDAAATPTTNNNNNNNSSSVSSTAAAA